MLDLSPGEYVKITVRDNGPGIAAEYIDRIFDPYFSTRNGETNAGLGLAVVHGIVKNYRGAVDVSTAPGRTVFDVYLPAS